MNYQNGSQVSKSSGSVKSYYIVFVLRKVKFFIAFRMETESVGQLSGYVWSNLTCALNPALAYRQGSMTVQT